MTFNLPLYLHRICKNELKNHILMIQEIIIKNLSNDLMFSSNIFCQKYILNIYLNKII